LVLTSLSQTHTCKRGAANKSENFTDFGHSWMDNVRLMQARLLE